MSKIIVKMGGVVVDGRFITTSELVEKVGKQQDRLDSATALLQNYSDVFGCKKSMQTELLTKTTAWLKDKK